MDLHMVARLLEKAHENSVLIRADRNEASSSRGQTSVVPEGSDESAATSEAAGDTSAEFGDRVKTIEMRECVAHADHQLGPFSRRKMFGEGKQFVTVRA